MLSHENRYQLRLGEEVPAVNIQGSVFFTSVVISVTTFVLLPGIAFALYTTAYESVMFKETLMISPLPLTYTHVSL